ncbi:hypothetical protein CEP54_016427, partial [Fusarium duplospermum]
MPFTDEQLHKKLDAFHDDIAILTSTSSPGDFNDFANHLSPVGLWYLGGMIVPPATRREDAISGVKDLLKNWQLKQKQRIVIVRAVANNATTAIAEMNNKLEIAGEPLNFPEIDIADFNDA